MSINDIQSNKGLKQLSDTVLASQVLSSGANNSSKFLAIGAKGVRLYLDVTAVSGTSPTLDVKVQVYDQLSDTYQDMAGAAFAQATAASSQHLIVYPGVAETANVSVSDVISHAYRIVGTVGGSATPTVTCSVHAEYLG